MELKSLLDTLMTMKASDLHLVVGQPPVYRINGELKRAESAPLTATDMETLLLPQLTAGQKRSLLEEKQNADFILREGKQGFRCEVFLERGQIAAAIRAIPLMVPTLDDLELSDLMQPILQSKRGLVLVTGPTGSGKSTTCAAIIETLNRTTEQRVFTIEDPIEYDFESKKCLITQHAVGQDVHSYETGVQMVFKSDPDIVLIGEMRSLEALWWAMTLADTGHLVFTVLHTNNTTESLRRILDVFPEPKDGVRLMLARTLTAIVSQRLLPRVDRPGRVAADELLLATPRIRQMIVEGQTDMTIAIEAGRAQGMQTMDDSVLAHYKAGRISYDTAWYTMLDRDRLGRPEGEAAGTP